MRIFRCVALVAVTCTIAFTVAQAEAPIERRTFEDEKRVDLIEVSGWLQGELRTREVTAYFESLSENRPDSAGVHFGRIWIDGSVIAQSHVDEGRVFVNLGGVDLSERRELSQEELSVVRRLALSPSGDAIRELVPTLIREYQGISQRELLPLVLLGMAIGEPKLRAQSTVQTNEISIAPIDESGDNLLPRDFCPGPDPIPNCTNPITQCLGCCGSGCSGCLNCCTQECFDHDLCCRSLGCAHPACLGLFPAAAASTTRCFIGVFQEFENG